MISLTAQFTMQAGKEQAALKLVDAVREEAERSQPGTLIYLVHRVLENGRPGSTLLFYECYRDAAALQAHLDSASWQAIARQWSDYFEGNSTSAIHSQSLERIGGFARSGAIPGAS